MTMKKLIPYYCPKCGLRYLKEDLPKAPFICYWHLQVFKDDVLLLREST